MELTNKQIKRQDFVDNRIFELIQKLNPSQIEINWDIEIIGGVRDCIQNLLEEKLAVSEEDFYPFLKENGN